MNFPRFAALALLCVAPSVFAQTASLTADNTALAPAGGQVVLTATVTYEGEPGALGWAIALPADWTLASVVGPNVPAISPDAGATGTLEFAFTAAPANRAEFSVVVRYPAGTSVATATPTVLVRAGGKLTTLKPAAIELRGTDAAGASRARN